MTGTKGMRRDPVGKSALITDGIRNGYDTTTSLVAYTNMDICNVKNNLDRMARLGMVDRYIPPGENMRFPHYRLTEE